MFVYGEKEPNVSDLSVKVVLSYVVCGTQRVKGFLNGDKHNQGNTFSNKSCQGISLPFAKLGTPLTTQNATPRTPMCEVYQV